MATCPNCQRAERAADGRTDRGVAIGPCLGGNCGSDDKLWTSTRRSARPIRFVLREGGKQPTRAHRGDAGWDLYASAATTARPGTVTDIPTGLFVEMPPGWWLHLLPRSSTFRKHNLLVVPAVIDNEYRGELFLAVYNPTGRPISVEQGKRLAQLVPHAIAEFEWVEVAQLSSTVRGDGGFGSTGE